MRLIDASYLAVFGSRPSRSSDVLGSLFLGYLGFLRASTHVQYTQTDTIRQTDGLLVPMVGLVPIEKDVIPMVLLVNMHLIKGT